MRYQTFTLIFLVNICIYITPLGIPWKNMYGTKIRNILDSGSSPYLNCAPFNSIPKGITILISTNKAMATWII